MFHKSHAAVAVLCLLFASRQPVSAQRYLTEYDSSLFFRDTVRPVVNRFSNLYISGYIQPEFQLAESKGAANYAGGNFGEYSNNRFLLRRTRMRIDYRLPGKEGQFPTALFTFQFEATERDVNVRDMFVRIYEPSAYNFSLTAGMFARPFGYEVNLSSGFRESPERGRMSQILMPSERDLGAMVSYEPVGKAKKKLPIRFDIGFFNGQGKSGPAEFDGYKDAISRLTLKPLRLSGKLWLSGGLSGLYGGWVQATKYRYESVEQNGVQRFAIDSSEANIGSRLPRHYAGADLQLAYRHAWGKTELRAEYWRGIQPGTSASTTNPGTLPNTASYVRAFDGAFFYFLQHLGNQKWELVVKYDWYDPNSLVSGTDIGQARSNFTAADIRYDTWGFGLTHYFNDNLKLLAYYDRVSNEATALPGFTADLPDDLLTLRIQFRF